MHRLIEYVATPFELDDATKAHALATAREKALTQDTARLVNLIAACLEVERWVEALLWPGPSGTSSRRVTSVVELFLANEPIPAAPQFPSTAGATVSVHSVKRWDDDAEDYVDDPWRNMPAGRLRVATVGTIEIVADVTPPDPISPIAVEGAARLWAYRELLRPVAGADGLAGTGSLSAAMFRSGASGILRSLKRRGRS